ncbi:hypothetical protein BGX30_007472 [Mortierella sp. GBA39]|nr:hypothetical protein BGX30_007472 [Mortierella sp. GBA39]
MTVVQSTRPYHEVHGRTKKNTPPLQNYSQQWTITAIMMQLKTTEFDDNDEEIKEDEEEGPGEEFLMTSEDDKNLPPDVDNASWLASASQTSITASQPRLKTALTPHNHR